MNDDPRLSRAEAALRDGRPGAALSLLGTAKGLRADRVRIEALQHHDPAGALPAVRRRARRVATTGDEVARLLEVLATPQAGTRREVMLLEAVEVARSPTLRARLMVGVGRQRARVTDTDDAERWLQRAEAVGVGDDARCDLEHLRGVIHLHRGEHEQAIVAFSRGLTWADDQPLDAVVLLRARARCWAAVDREEHAVQDYERAIELTEGRLALRRERAKLLNALGDLDRLRGDLDAAAERFHALLDMHVAHVNPVVYLNLALVEHARGRSRVALEHLRQVRLDRPRPFVALAHAVTHLVLRPTGQGVGARVLAVERALAHADHVDPDTMTALAEVLPSLEEPEHAARVARIVLHHARILVEPSFQARAEEALFRADIGLVGPYRVGERLGDGGSATVVRGVHLATGQEVAVKVLVEESADRLQAVELDAISALDHPNLVPLVDHGVVDHTASITSGWPPDAPWLATSLVDGGELRRTAPWSEVVGWLHDLLGALAHAHARGVLHLDIKPANVLHTADGLPLLTDFGIAARMGQARRLRAHTPDFAAPEQLPEQPAALGPWTDVFGLGATAWAWLAGRSPRRAPDRLDEVPLPAEARAWLHTATAVDPSHRFPDMATARAALPPRPTPPVVPATDRRERLAVRMRRGPPVPRLDETEALLDGVVDALAGEAPGHITTIAPPGTGHRELVRAAVQRRVESGRLRALWVDGDDLRAGLRALLGPTRHLATRPDVGDPDPLAAWLEGRSDDLTRALAELVRPVAVVRNSTGPTTRVPLPPRLVLIEVYESDTARAVGGRDTVGQLTRWLPELPSAALERVAAGSTYEAAVDHVRALVALGRIVDTATGPSLLPGSIPSRGEALGAVAATLGTPFTAWLGGRSGPWCPDPVPAEVNEALSTATRWGLAWRGTAGWWLSRALWATLRA